MDRLLARRRFGTAFLMGSRISPQVIGFAAALLTGLGAASFIGIGSVSPNC